MLSFSDSQLDTLSRAARALPVERRSTFLERVALLLALHEFDDDDLSEIVQLALCGLAQHDTAA